VGNAAASRRSRGTDARDGAYGRDHEITADGKSPIAGSADPAFRGDRTRWNPEDLFVASVSACHQLWYLHLAADAGIVVTAYADQAEGVMEEYADGSGRFVRVVLRPVVTLAAGSDVARAADLHHIAHKKCFIANSVNCPVICEPRIVVAD
jgi:organic hydroperoxide reductase OsmC/OhrA